jgi:ABC-type branched-subunit amino acid transport system substrate-binding protein
VKIREALDGDSQLNPQVSATVAGQTASNNSILALVGFAGSNENLSGGAGLNRARHGVRHRLVTADKLTDGKSLGRGNFFRASCRNNTAQANVGVDFMFKKLGLKKGAKAMIVDDAEATAFGSRIRRRSA